MYRCFLYRGILDLGATNYAILNFSLTIVAGVDAWKQKTKQKSRARESSQNRDCIQKAQFGCQWRKAATDALPTHLNKTDEHPRNRDRLNCPKLSVVRRYIFLNHWWCGVVWCRIVACGLVCGSGWHGDKQPHTSQPSLCACDATTLQTTRRSRETKTIKETFARCQDTPHMLSLCGHAWHVLQSTYKLTL